MKLVNYTKFFVASLLIYLATSQIVFAQVKDSQTPDNLNIFAGGLKPNFKIANGLGTANDQVTFLFISHSDGEQKFDKFIPSIEADLFYKKKDKDFLGYGFNVEGFSGEKNNSYSFAHSFLDILPFTGAKSPGMLTTDGTTSSFKIETDINSFLVNPYLRLDPNFWNSTPLSSLNEWQTDFGIVYNYLDYNLNTKINRSSDDRNVYVANEKVKHNSIGPSFTISQLKPIDGTNVQFIYGLKVAALVTEARLNASQDTTTVSAQGVTRYSVTDSNTSIGGFGTVSFGFLNSLPQGNYYLIAQGTVRNDISTIVNPRCTTGQDCDNTGGHGTAYTPSPSHLERRTNLSGALKVGIKLDF
jgi:hypothetical protein